MISKLEVEKAQEWALAMASQLPSEYRIVGFQELLRYKLVVTENASGVQTQSPATGWAPPVDAGIAVSIPEDHVIQDSATEEQKVGWAVARLSSQDDLAINETIGEFIRLNLSIQPPSRQNINRALRKLVPRYLSKEKHGRGYSYSPKRAIHELFANLRSDEA